MSIFFNINIYNNWTQDKNYNYENSYQKVLLMLYIKI